MWLAALSVEMLRVAFPELTVPAPSVAAPSLKVTVPVGLPAPGLTGATVAVKVTFCPKVAGLGAPTSAVVVDALSTTCVKMVDVLAAKLASPP